MCIFNDKILFFHIVIFANNEQEPAYFACWNKTKKDMHLWRKITCSYSLLTCITYHLTLLRFTIWSLNFQQVSMNVNRYNFFPHWNTSTFYASSCQMLFCQTASQMLSATWQRKYGLLMGMFKLLLYDQHPTLMLWSSYIIRAIIFYEFSCTQSMTFCQRKTKNSQELKKMFQIILFHLW